MSVTIAVVEYVHSNEAELFIRAWQSAIKIHPRLTLKALCGEACVSPRHLNSVLSGRSAVSLELLQRMQQVARRHNLDIPVVYATSRFIV
jgi:transcriptional regulator with XRE-family HTH domain